MHTYTFTHIYINMYYIHISCVHINKNIHT